MDTRTEEGPTGSRKYVRRAFRNSTAGSDRHHHRETRPRSTRRTPKAVSIILGAVRGIVLGVLAGALVASYVMAQQTPTLDMTDRPAPTVTETR